MSTTPNAEAVRRFHEIQYEAAQRAWQEILTENPPEPQTNKEEIEFAWMAFSRGFLAGAEWLAGDPYLGSRPPEDKH